MLQFELLILLALGMEIDPTHPPLDLIKTDIVEALKASALDGFELVVRNEEMLLPSHEDVFLLPPVFMVHGVYEIDIALRMKTERSPGRKSGPVRKIGLVAGAPCRVPCPEAILLIRSAYDLAGEESGQGRMIGCQSTNLEVPGHAGLLDVYGQDGYLDVVYLPV